MNSVKITPNRAHDDSTQQGCFSPKGAAFGYIGLILMSLLHFGPYFCYATPEALEANFKFDSAIPTEKFVLLYSVYTWTNVITCFIGGFLLDNVFGIRWGTNIYIMLSMIGQLIFATGAYVNIFWLMILGRLIFGIGTESLFIALNKYSVLWFKGKMLNTVFGLRLCVAELGSITSFSVMENLVSYVTETFGYTGPKRIGVVLFLISLSFIGSMICGYALGLMNNHAEKVLKRNEEEETQIVRLTDVKAFGSRFWILTWTIIAFYMPTYAFSKVVSPLVLSIAVIASPFIGILTDKTGRNMSWIIISIVGSLLVHGLLALDYVHPFVSIILYALFYPTIATNAWPLLSLVITKHLGTIYGTSLSLFHLTSALWSVLFVIILKNFGFFVFEMSLLVWYSAALVSAIIVWKLDRKITGGYLNMSPQQRRYYEEKMSYADEEHESQLECNSPTCGNLDEYL